MYGEDEVDENRKYEMKHGDKESRILFFVQFINASYDMLVWNITLIRLSVMGCAIGIRVTCYPQVHRFPKGITISYGLSREKSARL